jgi:hypothetical protein
MLNYIPQPAIHALRPFANKPLHRRARMGAAHRGVREGEELTDEDDEGEGEA